MPFGPRGIVSVVALLPALASPAVSAADLSVAVTGLRSDRGDVHVAVYDDPDRFPDGDGMLRETEAAIEDGVARAVFEDLPAGTYAVAVYHDEDSDDEFDQFVFGLPLEGYGFSNDAPVFFGPPSFAEASVGLGPAPREIAVSIRY